MSENLRRFLVLAHAMMHPASIQKDGLSSNITPRLALLQPRPFYGTWWRLSRGAIIPLRYSPV